MGVAFSCFADDHRGTNRRFRARRTSTAGMAPGLDAWGAWPLRSGRWASRAIRQRPWRAIRAPSGDDSRATYSRATREQVGTWRTTRWPFKMLGLVTVPFALFGLVLAVADHL